MQPLTAGQIRGNWATLLVPWNGDESLDVQRLESEIDALVRAGVDGIYSNGTAGEFLAQTETEFDLICRVLAGHCHAARVPFQIGVSHASPQLSLERLQRVVPLRPGAVQVVLPDWFPVSDTEAVAFLSRMADAADGIPLVLYNPPFAKRRLSPVDMARLTEQVPQVVGWKTAGGDDSWYASMREHAGHLSVFVPGHLLASGVQRGAHGAYSNVACLNPAAAQRWTNQILSDLPAALEVEGRLRQFMDLHIVPLIVRDGYCNAACDRLLGLIGRWADTGERMRWPYRSIPRAEAERLRPIAAQLIPEFITGSNNVKDR